MIFYGNMGLRLTAYTPYKVILYLYVVNPCTALIAMFVNRHMVDKLICRSPVEPVDGRALFQYA